MISWFETFLAHEHALPYVFADDELVILAASPTIAYLTDPAITDPVGMKLPDAFSELVGLELHLLKIAHGQADPLMLEFVHRGTATPFGAYYNIQIVSIPPNNRACLLMTMQDVTAQAELKQQLMQERNELRLNVLRRERAEAALSQLNAELEQRVLQRTDELQQSKIRLEALSNKLVTLQEVERRQVARELHDEIGQLLTGLNLMIGLVSKQVPAEFRAPLKEAGEVVNDLVQKVRNLSLDLRPVMLDDLGLLPALLWYFERFEKFSHIHVALKHCGIKRRFHPTIETTAFRAIQEALTNTARYAGVCEVDVQVRADEDWLSLYIQDDGKGCDPQIVLASHTSSGLSGMQERVRLVGGNLTLDSFPGGGTRLFVRLPVQFTTGEEI